MLELCNSMLDVLSYMKVVSHVLLFMQYHSWC